MSDEVVRAKAASVDRWLLRLHRAWDGNHDRLQDQTVEDALLLNLQRSCEACISIAMHVIARKKLGVPQESRQAFVLLEEAGILQRELSRRMQDMVGFRNVIVHQYLELDRRILRTILDERLGDFADFTRAVGKHV